MSQEAPSASRDANLPRRPLSVVIAPDSFKGSLGASAAAEALARGWRERRPHDRVLLLPQADGGEGTLDAIAAAAVGAVRHPVGPVAGPDLRPVPGAWLELPDRVAVVELALTCGLPLMRTPDALGATTRGLGEVIRHAIGWGIDSLVIALGGSATTDGGTGALSALGVRLLRADGTPARPGGGGLGLLATVDLGSLIPPPPGGVVLLTDVVSPLLGADGAAAVFGPQKGAGEHDVRELDDALGRLAGLLGGDPAAPGSGAAGGTAYGFATAWGAAIRPGAPYIAELSGLPRAVAEADVVLTGEGRFDATSLAGKVTGAVLRLARDARVGLIAGSIDPDAGLGCWSLALDNLAGSTHDAIRHPERWLRAAGREAAAQLGDEA